VRDLASTEAELSSSTHASILRCPRCRAISEGTPGRCAIDGTRLERLGDAARIGTQVDGYTIEGALGAGGMAEVYRVRSNATRAVHAMKLLTVLESRASVLHRFRSEAALMRALRHPNLVEFAGSGTTEDGVPYIVMELIEGRTVRDVVLTGGPMSVERTTAITIQAAEGLAAIHRAKIVHRDFKPANLMLITDEHGRERVKILDFGIARVTEVDDRSVTSITGRGHLLGTPGYMAPEQIRMTSVDRSESREELTSAADQYALGATMFFMLSAKRPYSGSPIASVAAVLRGEAPQPLPPSGGLEDLVSELLSLEAGQRPSAESVIARLRPESSLHHDADRHPDPAPEIADPMAATMVEATSAITNVRPQIVKASNARLQAAPYPIPKQSRARRSPARWIMGASGLAGLGIIALVAHESPERIASTAPLATPPVPESAPKPALPDAVVSLPAAPALAPVSPAPPTARPAKPKTDHKALALEIQRALSEAGLAAGDLALVDPELARRFNAPNRTADNEADVATKLRDRIRAEGASGVVLQRMLDRTLSKLRAVPAPDQATPAFAELQSRYLSLRETVSDLGAGEKLPGIAAQIRALDLALSASYR